MKTIKQETEERIMKQTKGQNLFEPIPRLNAPKNYECTRCAHKWLSYLLHMPSLCPHCHTPLWDRERLKRIQ